MIDAPDSTLYATTDNESVATRCPVCGIGDIGRHYHYGGRACSSCRAFFRRSVQNSSFKVSTKIAFFCLEEELIYLTITYLIIIGIFLISRNSNAEILVP